MIYLQWHELNTGNTYNAERKNGQPIRFKVLSFRDVKAIVIMEDGQYELLTPAFVNDELVSVRLHIDEHSNSKTKVEYVKVEFATIWEGIKAYEADGMDLYLTDDSGYVKIGNTPRLMQPLAMNEDIYRKIETEITWNDTVAEFCYEYDYEDLSKDIKFYNANGNTAMQSDFINLCHHVSGANK